MSKSLYIDVIVPLPLMGTFTYEVSAALQSKIQCGCRVVVPFGQRKTYIGIVAAIHTDRPSGFLVKEIVSLVDDIPVVTCKQILFWKWIASYYMCSIGDVYKAALPLGLKLESEERNRKTEQFVILNSDYQSEENLKSLFEKIKRAPKQSALLMTYISEARQRKCAELPEKELIEKSVVTHSIVNLMVEKGIFSIILKEASPLKMKFVEKLPPKDLSEPQKEAFHSILTGFERKDVVLLHGVTSSGKTEIYIHLIQKMLDEGKQVLYLLPEIALTTQITERLQKVFGSKLSVYHSKFSDGERAEVWNRLLREKEESCVVLGVRSSIFLPFHRLGLVIVDEEHENTYKQFDPAPRYHARNAAIMLAKEWNAKVLLGSATPSIESYYNTTVGKYALVELFTRYQDVRMPQIVLVDLREQRKKRLLKGSFSRDLIINITAALERKEQVILFQNRRGFAPMVECPSCSWIPKCDCCDVSLTYHKGLNQLVCHYCGAVYPMPNICPSCGSENFSFKGVGTEKIEDEVATLFPSACVARMDTDSTKSKQAYQNIITRFEQTQIDILIGTQMVTKGLDFDNVSVVGILNADSILNYPDFRSFERAYQMMSQVSGRAGRRNKQGIVILQTNQPEHPIIANVLTNDYPGMYQSQLRERELFKYPPFYRLISLYIKHKNKEVLDRQAQMMAEYLRIAFEKRVLGPDQPPVGRVQNYYIQKILIKVELNVNIERVHRYLENLLNQIKMSENFNSFQVYYDVDPM